MQLNVGPVFEDNAHAVDVADVRPENEAKKFVKALQNGTKAKLVIAGKAISKYKFALTDVSKAYDIVTNQGKTQRLTLNLTFKESR